MFSLRFGANRHFNVRVSYYMFFFCLIQTWLSLGGGSVAVEVLGVSTRVGHRTCTRAFLHVRHTRSLRGR